MSNNFRAGRGQLEKLRYAGREIELSTEHSASCYGIPVAIIDGRAFGPSDVYMGESVKDMVSGCRTKDKELQELQKRFCVPIGREHERPPGGPATNRHSWLSRK